MVVDSPVTKALMAGVTAVVAVWLVVVLAWPDAPFAITFDDAWYYFGIARNIAHGPGSTFDGLNSTNGYHPLWMAVCVVVFKLGFDDLAAARILLGIQVLVYGAALTVAVQIVARFADGWPALKHGRSEALKGGSLLLAATFAVVAGNVFVVKTFANGLESGVSVLALAVILWWGVRADGHWLTRLSPPQRRGVSVLLSLAFLARTDAALLIACAAIGCVVEWVRTRPRPSLPLVELLALPSIVIAAYLSYNHLQFGTFLQVSGLVKRAELGFANGGAFLGFVVVAALVQSRGMIRTDTGAGGGQKIRRLRFPRTGAFIQCSSWFAAFCIILVGYYVTLQTQVWLWYFCPVVLYLLVLLPLATVDFAEEALRTAAKGAAVHRALAPVWLVLGLPMFVAFVITGRQFADPNLRSIQLANAQAGEWMRSNVATTDRFASWDAGALGYFSHRSVVNLDGVVNSRRYYEAVAAGPTAVRAFLACEHVRFIVNHGSNEGGEDPDIASFIARTYGADVATDSTVVYTLPFAYSGVTAGPGGFDNPGTRQLAVHIYALPDRASHPSGSCRPAR